jgi:hypothetical protein
LPIVADRDGGVRVLAVAELSTDSRGEGSALDDLGDGRTLDDRLKLGLKRPAISSSPIFQSGHDSIIEISDQDVGHGVLSK